MNELLERYKIAVDGWPQGVDDDAVERALLAHAIAVGAPQRRIVKLSARGARDALDARVAVWWSWYTWDATWSAAYAVGARQTGNKKVEDQWLPLLDGVEAGLWLYWFSKDSIFWLQQPRVGTDARRRVHRDDGPAFEIDDWREYFVHGVLVNEQIVLRPETLTPSEILNERNAEVRRVMIDRFGAERLLRDGNAQKLSVDDWGTLWRLPLENDEPIVMVEVVNSTPEPDGSWSHYWLRVPPTTRTAREAVLWTHDLPAHAEPVAMT